FAPGRPPEACRDEAESLRSRTCALWQGFDGALSPLWTALGQLIVTEAFETSVANGFGNSTLAGTLDQSAGHLIGNGCQNGGHRQGRSDNTRGKHMGGAHRHADEGGRENSHRRCDFSRRAVLGAHRLVRQLLAD
ncbi:15602_t:CDS:2, partial [Entrophospora sp. SA101]